MRSGNLFVETKSNIQSKSYLSAKTFLDSPLLVAPLKSLNSRRGVISEPDLLGTSDAKILEGFSDQDTAPTTSNNLSISTASSSSSVCHFLETTTNTSNTITATSQDAKETSKPRRKKRPPKKTSNAIKPKIEIKMAPHKPRKSAPTECTTDEEDRIVYDAEDEPEPNSDYILNLGDYTYKGELVDKPNQSFIRYDFDNPIKKRVRNS
ncbi:hypothetical protein TNCV_1358151 [Trichonephila clavipes]|uniref:Uncharacterized protein n=1 Tax=Trichonephila clavipes TaxID=2585209 RepID=A0A8X6VID0_TRICX|nr:hypothetical protein TNCV_1358151 [Trichonephila clavipes]